MQTLQVCLIGLLYARIILALKDKKVN